MSRCRGAGRLTTTPPIRIAPPVMLSSQASIRKVVGLPEPEGPTRTDQDREFAVGDFEINGFDDLQRPIALLELFKADQCQSGFLPDAPRHAPQSHD